MPTRIAMLVLATGLAVIGVSDARPAAGTFPGRDGRIVFVSDCPAHLAPAIDRVAIDGSRRTRVARAGCGAGSPAVSPDGRRIVFDRPIGDIREGARNGIYVVDVSGRRRRLAVGPYGGPSRIDDPVWSPDGARIAFVADEGITVIDANGRNRRTLSAGFSPSWSPDGRMIAFYREIGPRQDFGSPPLGAFIMDTAGMNVRRIAPAVETSRLLSVPPPSWSPDSRAVALFGSPPDEEFFTSTARVTVAPVDGSPAVAVASGLDFWDDLSWSPDGSLIAFNVSTRAGAEQARVELYTVRPDGSALRRLTTNEPGAYDSRIAWSPDARSIAFLRVGPSVTDAGIHVVNTDGSGLRRVAPQLLSYTVHPAWMPDGSALVIRTAPPLVPLASDLYSLRRNGTALRRLTGDDAPDRQPAWSPDGRRLAFVRELPGLPRGPANTEIYVMNANGAGMRRVTDHIGTDESPSWSPDGRRIAFVRWDEPGRTHALYTIRGDGSDLRRVTTIELFTPFKPDPAWSPDGRRIVFVSGSATGAPILYDVGANGDGRRALFTASDSVTISSPSWSPDGKTIAFVTLDRSRPCRAAICSDLHRIAATGRRHGVVARGVVAASWSPSGRQLVVSRYDRLEIIRPDGRRLRNLPSTGPDNYLDPDWQPLRRR